MYVVDIHLQANFGNLDHGQENDAGGALRR
jgi:hypothetical protein